MNLSAQPYDRSFYDDQSQGSSQSAPIVLAALWRVKEFQTLVDVGCGVGGWVAAAHARGLAYSELAGCDGDYVPRDKLKIPVECFYAQDLSVDLRMSRTFDLALCLEVAEHLPRARAKSFVTNLASLADSVLFGAAVPAQGGTDHKNEDWPDYWAAFFKAEGMVQCDILRPMIWSDDRIEWWYRQNAILYTRDPAVIAAASALPSFGGTSLVHPQAWRHALSRGARVRGREAAGILVRSIFNRVRLW